MEEGVMDSLVITNEKEAWEALVKALNEDIPETVQVEFKGWPTLRITIKGEDFNGSIPTRVMPPIIDLQKEVYRLYTKARYNTEDIRKLSADEKSKLELIVLIKPGSTEFISDIFKSLNTIISASKMDGKETLILLLGISALIATSVGWQDWLKEKESEHQMDTTVELSKQETKRMEILRDAMSRSPELKEKKEAFQEFQDDIARKLKPTDQIIVNNKPLITGEVASQIVPKKRQKAEEIRIDGEFMIKEVKFPDSIGGNYKFSVTRITDKLHFTVTATPDKLTNDQISILKDGGFGLKKVYMQINAKKLRGEITSAQLVTISWPEADKDQPE